MKIKFLVSVFVLFFVHFGYAQNAKNQPVKADTTPSVNIPPKAAKDKKQSSIDSFPIPKKAALWSIIPGGGQVYNRKWWYIKVPIVYGALGTTIYFTSFNQKLYRKYKAADYNYRNSTDSSNPQTGDPDIPASLTSAARLREVRDVYFKRTQQMYILTGVTYLLGAAEAFTSAHLAHFDVNDDLSFRIKPSFEPLTVSGNALGLGIQMKF